MPSRFEVPASQPLTYVNCNLCGADDAERIRSDGPLHLVRCRRCGLIYVTPRLAADTVLSLYNRDYFKSGNGAIGGYRDYVGDGEYYLRSFRKRMRWVDAYAREGRCLLDVGCAAGFFMLVARERGWEVHGIEPAACIAGYARSQFGLDVFVGTLQEAGLSSETYDVVTLWDVLEHLPDLRRGLNEVNRVLRPGGLLVLETQNIDSWLPRMLGERWIHYGNDLHLFHLTPRTVTRLLADTGFQVLRITGAAAGKVCSLQFVADKLRHASRIGGGAADATLRYWPALSRRSIYVNLGDEMIVCAAKSSETA